MVQRQRRYTPLVIQELQTIQRSAELKFLVIKYFNKKDKIIGFISTKKAPVWQG